MKTITKAVIIGLAALLFTSCCEPDPVPVTVTESISYDTQDNVIKLGGQWVTSMNQDVTPFQKINWIGFDQSVAANTIEITSDRPILQVLNPSFYLPHTITHLTPYKVRFYSEYYNYYRDNNDVFYFVVVTQIN